MRKKRILAISSAGGHWVQLLRIKPALEGNEIIFASTVLDYRKEVAGCKFYKVNEASQWNKFKLIILCFQILGILIKVRPDVVISTGAAPGFIAIVFSKIVRAKSIWLDSIANSEELSLSGRKAGKYCDLWLTQWSELERKDGPFYKGAVI